MRMIRLSDYLFLLGCILCIACDPAWRWLPPTTNRLLSSIFEPDEVVPGDSKNAIATTNCPAIIQRKKGVYSDPCQHDETTTEGLRNVVLLTAASQKFERFHKNWELHAKAFGLQWVLLAFDRQLYESYKETALLISSNQQMRAAGRFRTQSYNTLVCNKIRMVKDILEGCGAHDVDGVLFSDADNIFLQDPFAHELGDMILSGRHDYIYQVNEYQPDAPREHSCVNNGTAVLEGNTGFHFLKNSENMISVLTETLRRCDEPTNKLDDQTLLWNVLREANQTWSHCPAYDKEDSSNELKEGTSQYCCMDPYYYPTARFEAIRPEDLVVFHANFCFELDEKEYKLSEWGGNNSWSLPRSKTSLEYQKRQPTRTERRQRRKEQLIKKKTL